MSSPFLSQNLSELEVEDTFGQDVNRPFMWQRFKRFAEKLAADLNLHLGLNSQAIAMEGANHALVSNNPGAAQTVVTSMNLIVTPGASAELTLTQTGAKAIPKGRYFIVNAAGAAHDITIKNAGGTTICTISQNERGIVINDGTNLYGGIFAQT